MNVSHYSNIASTSPKVITISAVDISKSFIVISQTAANANRSVAARLTSSTEVTLLTNTPDATTQVEFSVITL